MVLVYEQFGPYRLESLIGRGGMGNVYRAFDVVKGRTVALKRFPLALATDPSFRTRFRRESELAARLREPHVIPIHDFGEIDGQLFIDMRLVDGSDLAAIIRAYGMLPPTRSVHIVSQVAGALDAAHEDGLVHRDVKPSNVLISGRDGQDFVYLIDFGIARPTMGTSLTSTGLTVGTLAYMAPEQFERSDGDHRIDVYSLTCLLYESLTGARPFPGNTFERLLYAHQHAPPPRPSMHESGIPPAFDDVIAKGMAKSPKDRYESARALAVDAQRVLDAAAGNAAGGITGGRAIVLEGRGHSEETMHFTRPSVEMNSMCSQPVPASSVQDETDPEILLSARAKPAFVALVVLLITLCLIAIFTALPDEPIQYVPEERVSTTIPPRSTNSLAPLNGTELAGA